MGTERSRVGSPSPRTLVASHITTQLGLLGVLTTEHGLACIELAHNSREESFLDWRSRWAPDVEVVWDAKALRGVTQQLESYGRGELQGFDVRLDLRGTPFQLACWRALCRIPYGQCRTYAALAEEVSGTRRHARAVGQANGANPCPVIVPCHRVLAANGLGGYSGGLPFKAKLLQLEGIHLPLG